MHGGGTKNLLHLSLFFTCCIRHSYLPSAFMDTAFVPLLKNKTGDITDAINYRAIAISNAKSKLLENVILQRILSSLHEMMLAVTSSALRKGIQPVCVFIC